MIYHYAHMERFANREINDYKKYNGKLIIYGAGRIGAFAAHALSRLGVSFACYCDSSKRKHGLQLQEHDVISPEELQEKYPNVPVLIAASRYEEIFEKLASLGYTEILDCTQLFDGISFDGFNYPMSQNQIFRIINRYYQSLENYLFSSNNKLRSVIIFVTEKCTLRCMECNSLMQYFETPADCDLKIIELSLERIFFMYNYLDKMIISGGETLLYKPLSELIDYICINFKDKFGVLEIVTNATVMPDEKLMKSLLYPEIYIKLSDYGGLSMKMNELVELFKNENINYEKIYQFSWYRHGGINKLNRTENELIKVYKDCCMGENAISCFLANGRLYRCKQAACGELLEAIPFVEDDSINLLEEPFDRIKTKEKIEFRFNDKKYIEACKYCSGIGDRFDPVPIAEQTAKPLPYEKYHYNYPERLACIPKPDIDAANGNIVIYGTETTGMVTANALEQRNISFLCFADTDIRKHGEIFCKHKIISPQELADKHTDAIVLVASSAYRQIIEKLLDLGFSKHQIFPCSHVIEGVNLSLCSGGGGGGGVSEEFLIKAIGKYNHACFIRFKGSEQRIINELVILPTSRCSLKCKECLYRIPYLTGHKENDVKQIENAIKKIFELNYKIDTVTVIGGEPLLYNDLPNLVHSLCQFKCIDNVTIVTNGTHSIKPELLNTLIANKDKLIVRISNYGKLSSKAAEIETLLTANNIRVGNMKQKIWIKTVPPYNIGLTDIEVQKLYTQCTCPPEVSGQMFFYDGKYLPCWQAVSLINTSFMLPSTDFIYLDDPNIAAGLKKMFSNSSFYEICRYCTKYRQGEKVKITVAEQLE